MLTEIKDLRCQIRDLKNLCASTKVVIDPGAIYNNREIRQILDVDERLVKKYRDNGYLSYIRQGDKYWYQGSDILDFLNKSRIEAFA